MKKTITIIIAILIIILQIYLVSVQPIDAKVASTYDDVLMVEQASSILDGKWLGDYNCLTLVKGPFTPIFMAVARLLHIPFLIAQDVFYIIACVLLIYVFKNIVKSNILKIITLTLLIFNPIIYSTELCRAYRDGIYLALIIYLIAFSFAIFLSLASGNMHAAAAILLLLITTAPSCSGVFGVNIFTNNCGDISLSNFNPVSIMSFICISLSITINAPVFCFANSIVAITILYMFSFVFVYISFFYPNYNW